MNKTISCDIIRDLLPSYADGLTSSASNQLIEEHLPTCESCAAFLKTIRTPELPAAESKQINYLKKVKKNHKKGLLITAFAAALIVLLLLFTRISVIGSEIQAKDADYQISVSDGTVRFTAHLQADYGKISNIRATQTGDTLRLTLSAAPSWFPTSEKTHKEIKITGSVTTVMLGDWVIWENGTQITPETAALYAAKHPYIGDMPANNKLALAVGIPAQFGTYRNELQTAAAPYGWTITLDTPTDAERKAFDLQTRMRQDAYLLLALTDNLSNVTFRFTENGKLQSLSVSAEEASAALGTNVKQIAASPSALQAALETLHTVG